MGVHRNIFWGFVCSYALMSCCYIKDEMVTNEILILIFFVNIIFHSYCVGFVMNKFAQNVNFYGCEQTVELNIKNTNHFMK